MSKRSMTEGMIQLVWQDAKAARTSGIIGKPEDIVRFIRLMDTEEDWKELAERLHVTIKDIG